ncbi:hypothetical protein KC640_00440 [Candidatus Dojkabacteria bacterium]|uniref:Uncharacterized protein n=1 Tax=Candidatus Dojkabacteria bacterium TaxID=2099670 RepID=A0A955KYL4_9BACT|nr:hypothetical protein [Candidatus Dojkabacteria bacterium]
MRRRKLLTSGIIMLMISLPVLIYRVSIVDATQPNFDPDLEIFYQDSKNIYKSRGFSVNEKVIPLEGTISSSTNKFAYRVITENSHQPNPFVYILDINNNLVLDQIPVNSSLDLRVLNWSPDDRYIVLREAAHYVGGLVLHIIDYNKKQEMDSFYVLNDYVTWISNTEFLFFDPYSGCPTHHANTSKCRELSPALSLYNAQNGRSRILRELGQGQNTMHEVTYQESREGKIIYIVRTYNKENGVADFSEWNDVYYQYDLNAGELQNISRTDLLIEQVSNALPQPYSDLSIQKIIQNSKQKDSYLVQLSSLKDDQRHYVGVFDTDTGEFELRGRGLFPRWRVNK